MGGFRRLARAAFGAALAGGRRVGTRSVSRTWTVDPAYVATRSRRESTLPMGARFASSSSSNDEPSTSGSGSVEVHGWGSTGEDVTDPDGSTRRDLEIAIDRTGLFRQIDDAHGGSNPATKNLVGLEKHFASIINFRGGPITVAEYMQEVLTHPEFGYYMHRDVFGEKGDFITSPEVSQVFGELMGAWAVWQWKTMGSPKECHLIELGPGRGTLMADLLRGTSVFPEFTAAVTVHLVEVSPKNRATQREKLRCSSGRDGASSCSDDARSEGAKKSIKRVRVPKNPMAGVVAGDSTENSTSHSTATGGLPAPGGKPPPYQPGAHGSTPEELGLEAVDFGFSEFGNVRVEWHETLDGVPGGPSIVLAHEFFDAMPVHQFTRTERGWCERLVAIRGSAGHGGKEGRTLPVASRASQSESKDDSKSNHEDQNPPRKGALEMVLSPGLTPAGALLIPKRLDGLPSEEKEGLRQLEISPRTLAIWERVAERVEKHGGAALAIDYGEEGPIGASLQAIRDHKFVDVLEDPGTSDLSTYVDFGAMRQVVQRRDPTGGGVTSHGPVSQRDLLFGLGIEKRLHTLIDQCETTTQAERVYDACARLVGGDELAEDSAGIGPGMGFRYKAIAIVSKGLGTPAGFETGES